MKENDHSKIEHFIKLETKIAKIKIENLKLQI